MAYQPTFPSPYLTSIDVNKPETCVLSCVINPRDKISQYYVRICEADSGLVVGYIIGGIFPDGFKKGYYNANLSAKLSYTFIHSWGSYTTTDVSGYDTALPLEDSVLRIAIPQPLLGQMSNGRQYVWKIGLDTDKSDLYPICSATIGVNSAKVLGEERPYSKIYLKDSIDRTIQNNYCDKLYLKYRGGVYLVESVQSTTSWTSDTLVEIDTPICYYENEMCELCTYNVHSQDFTFYTMSTPTIEFIDPPDVVDSFSYTFKASYSSDTIQKMDSFCYRLYSAGVLIDDTGKLYSAELQYTYNKFEADKNYELELEVEDEYGNIETISHSFDVKYTTNTIPIIPVTNCNKSGFVDVDYSTLALIEGKGKNYEYTNDDTVSINSNGYLLWDETGANVPLQIPYDSTTILKIHFHQGFRGDIFTIQNGQDVENNIKIWFEDGSFYWRKGYDDTISIAVYTKEESAIKDTELVESGDVIVSDDTRYIINDTDEIESTDEITIIANDTLNHYWWYIIARPYLDDANNIVRIIRGEAC